MSGSTTQTDPWDALREYCAALPYGGKPKLARALGTSPSRLAHIIHDRERPSGDLAYRISRVCPHIPVEAWFRPGNEDVDQIVEAARASA